MKHGDKAKSKKAIKASGKKSSKASKKSSKVAPVKAKANQASQSKKSSSKTAGNGKSHGRSASDVTFTNPIVAAAFKRAVRKYPNAFRRLTD